LLAPSKTMDSTSTPPVSVTYGEPLFNAEAAVIANRLKKYSAGRIAKLMSVSKAIASDVVESYDNWDVTDCGRPAIWTYKGDVYKGVRAEQLDRASADWAQEHLLILSGLYGLVRPFDGIQPYRLEMKTAIKIGRVNNLHEFWGDKLSKYITERGNEWVCNLSSDEYARPALKHLPKDLLVVTPVFFDKKPNGVIGTVPIYSKMMRGVMARWMIDHRVTSPQDLEAFDSQNYFYDAERSRPGFPAFRREVMTPLRFV
jgi:cytoplasmic iron level regulating protein YaaA (DUF328/UPF0246 family)